MNDSNDIPRRPVDLLFAGRREAIAAERCIRKPIGCGNPTDGFDSDLSLAEFRISGLCQACQDEVFGA